jgi:hypothetical protein
MIPFSTTIDVINGVGGHGQIAYLEGPIGVVQDLRTLLDPIFASTPNAIILNSWVYTDWAGMVPTFYGVVMYYVPGTSFGAELSIYTPGTF